MQGIYRLLFPNNKCYIGLSNNLKRRLSEYKNLRCKKQPEVYKALKLFGWSNVKVDFMALIESVVEKQIKATTTLEEVVND